MSRRHLAAPIGGTGTGVGAGLSLTEPAGFDMFVPEPVAVLIGISVTSVKPSGPMTIASAVLWPGADDGATTTGTAMVVDGG